MGLLGKLFGSKSGEEWKVDNTALLRAIQSVASADSPQNRDKLYRLLLDCVLFVPVREIPEALRQGGNCAGRPCDISLQQLRDKQQKPVTPAFTDEEALRNWDPNTPFLGIRAREYFRMVKGTEISAILINPFDPIRKMLRPGGRIARFEFEALAEGIVPGRLDSSGALHMTFAEGKTPHIGSPAKPLPGNILDALVTTGRRAAAIKELYLFEMGSESGDAHAAIGIDLSRPLEAAELRQVLRNLADIVHPLLAGRNYLDFMVLSDSLGEEIRKVGKKLLYRD
jgi:SseB protein N-terminal domain/SseB protein C-terminal domain